MSWNKEDIGCLGIILTVVILILVLPFLSFAEGWLMGLLIKWTFGGLFCEGMTILGIGIIPEQIPLITGVISVLGSIFGGTKIINNND